jgi:hypothetical protein
MRSLTATLAFLAAAAGAARADEVVLRNGARFEGEVKESGNSVIVKMDFGTITFRKMDVARIERGHSALQEFDAALEKLKDGDPTAGSSSGSGPRRKGSPIAPNRSSSTSSRAIPTTRARGRRWGTGSSTGSG